MSGSLRDEGSSGDRARLLAAATPRPWRSSYGDLYVCDPHGNYLHSLIGDDFCPQEVDADLAALAVNEYEALLECAAALARLCEFTRLHGHAPAVNHSPAWAPAWAALAALAEIRGAE